LSGRPVSLTVCAVCFLSLCSGFPFACNALGYLVVCSVLDFPFACTALDYPVVCSASGYPVVCSAFGFPFVCNTLGDPAACSAFVLLPIGIAGASRSIFAGTSAVSPLYTIAAAVCGVAVP
jgi:hypothetical protein